MSTEVKIKHQKTYTAKTGEVEKKWYIIDAEGVILGRLATKAARLLRGKDKTVFTPHIDTGDFVVIINADKIKVSGNKLEDKIYYSHSGYPGGLKETSLEKQMEKDSRKVIMAAVKGMLPKGRLGRKVLTKCKVFKDSEHNHDAQKPEKIEI